MPNLPEIVVILVVIALVFGFGRIAKVGSHLSRSREEFLRGLGSGEPDGEAEGPDVIDITPDGPGATVSASPKPGARVQPIEDAELD